MKNLVNFESNSEFESAKTELDNFSDYAALSEQEREVHVKELPYMADIAIWDEIDEKAFMVRGYEYNADDYPFDRYKPFGVEVIPKSHVDGIHSKLISIACMDCDKPMYGGTGSPYFGANNPSFGSNSKPSEIQFDTEIPYINESGTTNFGYVQKIKGLYQISDTEHVCAFSGDDYTDIAEHISNPFTKNESYYSEMRFFIPSPYNIHNGINDIFYSNPTLARQNGKELTELILYYYGNDESWKENDRVINQGNAIYNPACRCAWMYCLDVNYKNNPIFGQGRWYIPTLGELAYACARKKAINASMKKINDVTDLVIAYPLQYNLSCLNYFQQTRTYTIFVNSGYINIANAENSYTTRAYLNVEI